MGAAFGPDEYTAWKQRVSNGSDLLDPMRLRDTPTPAPSPQTPVKYVASAVEHRLPPGPTLVVAAGVEWRGPQPPLTSRCPEMPLLFGGHTRHFR